MTDSHFIISLIESSESGNDDDEFGPAISADMLEDMEPILKPSESSSEGEKELLNAVTGRPVSDHASAVVAAEIQESNHQKELANAVMNAPPEGEVSSDCGSVMYAGYSHCCGSQRCCDRAAQTLSSPHH